MAKFFVNFFIFITSLSLSSQQSAFHETFSQWTDLDYSETTEETKCQFHSKSFLDDFYSESILKKLSEIFSSGNYSGFRLIDIGTGPSLHSVISASDHYDKITVSEFTDDGCQEIQMWLDKDERRFNLSSAIQYVSTLEDTWSPAELESQLRRKVKHVLKSDLRKDNPFHPYHGETADCVMTSICLGDLYGDSYLFNTLYNVSTLLRPEGTLVIFGVMPTKMKGKRMIVIEPGVTNNLQHILNSLWFQVEEIQIFAGELMKFIVVANRIPMYGPCFI